MEGDKANPNPLRCKSSSLTHHPQYGLEQTYEGMCHEGGVRSLIMNWHKREITIGGDAMIMGFSTHQVSSESGKIIFLKNK